MLLAKFLLAVFVHVGQSHRDDSSDGFGTDHQEESFDLEDLTQLRQVLELYGFDLDRELPESDNTILGGIESLFASGDARRWATANFVYQLACYQGRKGSLLSKALWVLGKYNGYACYCGGGSYSGNYLDATDYCCKLHDVCYIRVQKKYKLEDGCHTYTIPYYVSCCENRRMTKCTDSGPSAGRELCECDQAMSKCVAQSKALRTYNKSYYRNRRYCRNGAGKYTKPMSLWEILKSCKHAFKPIVKFRKAYGSQGKCPARKEGWRWGDA